VALLVRAAISSLVRMLPELVRQHQVSRWLFHQTWLCSPYCSIMGDISYAVFVDSHRIPSSLLFLCGFLYRDPAGTVLRFQQVRYQAYSLEGDRWPQTCKSQLFVHIQAFVPHVRASRISTYCYTVRAPQSHLTRFQE
jgi:hypothetical protein